MIFDSHAHYDSEKFDTDRDEILAALPKSGVVGVINCASDLESSKFSVELSEKYNYVYAAVGVHPHECEGENAYDEELLCKLSTHQKVVAIGEIGLDYHYDFAPRDRQREIFEKQIMLSKNLSLPIIVHDREAHGDTMDLLRKHQPFGVIHCFSGSVEMAKEAVKLGLYIGLGGAVTFKNARVPLEVAEFLPLDRLLLETDCPYMTPVPYRGQRCDSRHIAFTAQKIAQVKGMDVDEILTAAHRNAKELFKI